MSGAVCPICGNDVADKYRPFCSRRCADIDLAKWLGGGYAIPSHDPEDQERAEAEVEISRARDGQKPH